MNISAIQGFLAALLLFPVNIILPLLHTHLHLHVTLSTKTNGERVETVEKAGSFG